MLWHSVFGSFLLSLHRQCGLSLLSRFSTSAFICFVSVSMLRMCRRILGWSALSGVAVVLVAYVLNYPLAKYKVYVCDILLVDRLLYSILMQISRCSWKAKDRRMDVVNELLQNIRFLKYYGWGQYISSNFQQKFNSHLFVTRELLG